MFPGLVPLLVRLVPGCIAGGRCDPEPVLRESARSLTDEELTASLGPDGELTAEACEALCRDVTDGVVSVEGCELTTDRTDSADTASWGKVYCSVIAPVSCKDGRHHVTVEHRPAARGSDPLGVWLADSALAEETSVKAFVSLGAELRRFGAPEALIAGARSAAIDEVKHARIFHRLADERGVRSGRPTFGPTPRRSLVDFAIENGVEGCVHETWAALVARVQARDAESPALGAACATIAADEARHAELAWAIDAWLRTVLTDEERGRVDRARADAVEALAAAFVEPVDEVRRAAGAPSVAEARTLHAELTAALWGPAAVA